MLNIQATDFFEDLKTLFKNSGISTSLVYSQIQKCKFGKLAQDAQTVHNRTSVIKLLVLLKVCNIASVYRCMNSNLKELLPFGKDLLYKVKNSAGINWRSILFRQAYTCMDGIEGGNQQQDGDPVSQPCFILDDTDLPKRGKAIEFIGRIYSHVTQRYQFGFKSMNLAYWSGSHLLHLDFSLHIELGKNGKQGMTNRQLSNRYSKSRNNGSPGHKRACEVLEKKTISAIRMMRRAIATGFQASYILADSWFFSQQLVNFARSENIDLITRPKFNNWNYQYNDKTYTLGNLIKKLRYTEKKKWNKQLKMHHLSVPVIFKGTALTIFFYKEKKRGTPWQAIVTTDRKIGAIQAYRIYQNRWAIEVSYKELKQLLGAGKCQSRDFDAQVADLTFSLMAYNYLSHTKAINQYQSIGWLFQEVSQNWISPNLMQRFWGHLYKVIHRLAQLFDKNVEELLDTVMRKDDFLKEWRHIARTLGAET